MVFFDVLEHIPNMLVMLTAPIPKEWGRYYFHSCLSVNISGEHPHLADGGELVTPIQLMVRYPHPADGGYPIWPMGEVDTPPWGTPLSGLDGGTLPPPSGDRAAERALATRRAVLFFFIVQHKRLIVGPNFN